MKILLRFNGFQCFLGFLIDLKPTSMAKIVQFNDKSLLHGMFLIQLRSTYSQ